MLVITAISGFSSRKLASLSSASATTHSPSPQPALAAAVRSAQARAPRRRRRRPGRRRSPAAPRPASRSSSSCRGCRRPRSGASRRRARRAARRGAGPRGRARGPRRAPGCPRRSRSRRRPPPPSGRLAASWPTTGVDPRLPQPLHVRGVGAVAAADRGAEPAQTSARPLIPAPPMPMKCSLPSPAQSRSSPSPRAAAQDLVGDPRAPRRGFASDAEAADHRRQPRLVAEQGADLGGEARRRSSPRPRSTTAAPASAIQAALAVWWSAVACG